MAEFQEVMRQLGRICSTNFGGCDICDLRPFCPATTFMDKYAKSVRAARLEEMVMLWAAEHPEPVYPTWGEYLASIGIMKPAQPNKAYEVWFSQLYSTNIAAGIAQKLGIEPKEG